MCCGVRAPSEGPNITGAGGAHMEVIDVGCNSDVTLGEGVFFSRGLRMMML